MRRAQAGGNGSRERELRAIISQNLLRLCQRLGRGHTHSEHGVHKSAASRACAPYGCATAAATRLRWVAVRADRVLYRAVS